MANLFEGLEIFGFENIEDTELYVKEVRKKEDNTSKGKKILPEDCVFDRVWTCPICDHEFTSRAVKTGKARMISSDSDLRPYFSPIDPMYYDVVMCPQCGYTALTRFFLRILQFQATRISEKITPNFKSVEYPKIFTVDVAIERYKLALYNALIKRGKAGEKAFISLKIGWLYREKKDMRNELTFLSTALDGFKEAYTTEDFPICGMDPFTLTFLIAELSRRLGDNKEALKWAGYIVASKTVVSSRLNDRLENLCTQVYAELKKSGDMEENIESKRAKPKKKGLFW